MGTTIDKIWTGKTRAAHRALSSGSRFGPDPQITILARGIGQAAHQRPDTRPHSITALIGKKPLAPGAATTQGPRSPRLSCSRSKAMPQLFDSQLVVLTAACQRPDRCAFPITAKLKGNAAGNVLKSLLNKGLIKFKSAPSAMTPSGGMTTIAAG